LSFQWLSTRSVLSFAQDSTSDSSAAFAYSVGGIWDRLQVGGRTKLLCKRLLEISLTSVATNPFAQLTAVSTVSGVKAMGSLWVPASMDLNEQIHRAVQIRSLECGIDRVALALAVLSIQQRVAALT
jgi:hypothetical protein